MRKYYLYLIVFSLLASFANVGAYAQLQSKTGKRATLGLKFAEASASQKENRRTASALHQRKSRKAPLMKIDGNKELWGFLICDMTEEYIPGLGTFGLTNPAQFSTVYPSETDASAGACVEDVMYLQYKSYVTPLSFVSVDLLTGEETELGTYESNDVIFLDMTYDYVTGTMYAVAYDSEAEMTFLYTVDLETGVYEEVFPLSYDLVTLAADNQGNMYGISLEGDLCRIVLDEQYVEPIGVTNEFPCYLQSMDFDREDNILYWAGFTEEGNGFLATIDTETGEATRIADPLGENAEIVALHVPVASVAKEAPAAVKELSVQPGEKGALTVKLSWLNPDRTVGGDALASLTKIDIYRGETLVHTLNNPVPGEKAEWTDTPEQSGYVAYKLVAFNEEGEGKAAKTNQTFVGRDIPVAVSEALLTKEEGNNKAHISWKAPAKGVNGGWMDVENLKYDVIRYPEHKKVAGDLTATSYIDESITTFNAYYYQIIPKTADGEGEPKETNKIFMGDGSVSLPYSCDFSTEELRNLWIIEDANGDGCTWKFGNHYKGTQDWFLEYDIYNYEVAPTVQADEWFFSAPFKFEAGKHYLLKFRVRLGGELAQEKFRAVLCREASHEALVKVVGDYTDLNDQNFQEVSVSFEVDETGEYHLGFQCYSDPNQWIIQITDISLREAFPKDMESVAIKGMTAPVQNEKTSYEVTICNAGVENISSCRVEVVDENLNVLGANEVNRELVPQQSLIVEVRCMMPQAGAKQLRGRVIFEGDSDMANNLTPVLAAEVFSEERFSWQHLGTKAEMAFSPIYPFAADRKYGRAQTLYLASELNFASGKIDKLVYYYYISPNFGVAAQDTHISVYLANTDVASLKDDYLPEEQFTKVFEGAVSLNPLNNVLQIDLDAPFDYTGKNLCVFMERNGVDEMMYAGNNFLYTTDEDKIGKGRTRYYFNEDIPYDSSVENFVSNRLPNVSLLVDGKILSSIGKTEEGNRVTVYPNPVVDKMYITGEYTGAELFSVNGASVKQIESSAPVVDMTGLNSGVYFLKVRTEKTVEVHKVIVK